MNFIQLTDLHIGDNGAEEFDNLNRIIKHIKVGFPPDTCPLVIITGDFVHHGSEVEYKQVVNKLKELTAAGYKLLACPGNHDFGQGTKSNWDNYQPVVRNRYLKYIHNELLEKDLDRVSDWDAGKTIFPVITPLMDKKIVFVGLDTMHGVLEEDKHFATGRVDDLQVSNAVKELTKPQYTEYVKVVYMHHSLYSARPSMYLKGREKLTDELVSAGVNMVCFGHTHNYETYEIKRLNNDVMKSVCGRKVTDEFRPNDGFKHTLEFYHYTVTPGKVSSTTIRFQ